MGRVMLLTARETGGVECSFESRMVSRSEARWNETRQMRKFKSNDHHDTKARYFERSRSIEWSDEQEEKKTTVFTAYRSK